MHTVLAARSTFSIGESILTVEELIDQAKLAGATAVGLTDTMSVTGLIDFTNRAKKAEIKPIVGCRLRLVDDHNWRKPKGEKSKLPGEWFVTYYVRSEKGLVALFKLLSLANDEAHFYYTAKLGIQDFLDTLGDLTGDDVAIASGDTNSLVAHPQAGIVFKNIVALIGKESVFMTLTPIDTPYFDRMNAEALKIAGDQGLPTLATRPVLYEQGGADAADIKNAVSRNIRMSDLWIQAPEMRNLHPMGQKEFLGELVASAKRLPGRYMTVSTGQWKIALENTDGFVARITWSWSKAPIALPVMAPDEYEALKIACKKGWGARMGQTTFGHKPTTDELRDVYAPRLVYELSVLKKLGFSGYFLLVKDIVDYAKTNGILVGPGRGSVGGSLVAYLTGITDCDPIRFGLLFERFINPDRIDLPDADLDFMSERRHEIIEYLIGKYGQARVAGISNFSTLAAASSIRNVGKALGLSEDDYRCSKFTPKAHGANIPLPKAADMVSEIGAFRDKWKGTPGAPGPWDVMVRLEDTMTNYGRHAAGIVVGGVDLTERGVIERRKDGDTLNWDKRIVEDQGLVKVDILGLSTLDLIDLTLKYIKKRHAKHVNLLRIPLDDEKVLAQFAAGKTTGVFQFASGGMRRLLKELGKDGVITFDDITAATALYRPGPMESGMMDSFFKRKQGVEAIEYDHPLLEPILKDTYGVFVYQEEVMQASRALAGYSGPDADKLRKIMGKKLPLEMAKEKGKFISGCEAEIFSVKLDNGSTVDLRSNEKYQVEEGGFHSLEEIEKSDFSLCFPVVKQ
jgi:DNA polymerase-3 subunit alpha